MKFSLAVHLAAFVGVSVAGEAPTNDENQMRDLSSGYNQHYPAYHPTKYYPVYKTPYPTHKQPTPYPTGQKPTPNPTPKPTPYPTPYPTKIPTPYPTRDPYYNADPYYPPQRTPRPTPYPTKNPTPQPTPEPTRSATLEPSDFPSRMPSEEPTSSEEPSENPTGSEEPSENPTGSEEPSENPTESIEPSDSPSELFPLIDPTIYDIICDIRFNRVLGLLCDFVQLNPSIAELLGAPPERVRSLDFPTILNRARNAVNSGGRNLQNDTAAKKGTSSFLNAVHRGNGSRIAAANQLTLFAPTNYAFLTMPNETLEQILAPDGGAALADLLQLHITKGKTEVGRLFCDASREMINGDETTTRCRNGFKFQVGPGNQMSKEPQIVISDIDAINGFIHVTDEVIQPKALQNVPSLPPV